MRLTLSFLLLTAMPLATAAQAPAPCTKAPSNATTAFFVEPVAVGPRDSTVRARLCLRSKTPVGSYMALMTHDSAQMRVVTVTTSGGMQVVNSRVAGVIRIAGAAPAGFASGVIAIIEFRPRSARTLGRIALSVPEASGTDSRGVQVQAGGWPLDPPATSRPVVDSISPNAGEVGTDRVTDLVLYGRGFSPAGNVVLFGDAEVRDLAADRAGTIIRFSAPTHMPTRDGPRRVGPGKVLVRVRSAAGTSNSVAFTVKDDQ